MGLTDKEPMRACGGALKNVCVFVGLLSCVCVCAFVSMFCFAFCLHLWICVSVCVRENTVRESFDTTAFLSWRHLQPSSNLSVYQAKILSERLLRQLDNPPHNPPNHHTHTHPHNSSCNPLNTSPTTYREAQKGRHKTTNTHVSSPIHTPSNT